MKSLSQLTTLKLNIESDYEMLFTDKSNANIFFSSLNCIENLKSLIVKLKFITRDLDFDMVKNFSSAVRKNRLLKELEIHCSSLNFGNEKV